MKLAIKRLALSLIVVVPSALLHAETNYFLVGAAPGTQPQDSVVIPLWKPEDIQHARDLIVRGQQAGAPMAAAAVACGKDRINRNYLDPTFPEWSWHVVKFNGFADVCAEGIEFTPTQLEALFRGCGTGGTNNPPEPFLVCFGNGTVLRDLGPVPLALSITPDRQDLEFYWSTPGTNFVFTLESNQRLSSTDWVPVPGASWPLQTNHWTLPKTEAATSFFRVRAKPGP